MEAASREITARGKEQNKRVTPPTAVTPRSFINQAKFPRLMLSLRYTMAIFQSKNGSNHGQV